MQSMNLRLFHGRKTVKEDMDDWGFNGPTLEGITSMHVVYMATYTIEFESVEAKDKAQALTGWNSWCKRVLEMNTDVHGLIKTTDEKGECSYYGDWTFYLPTETKEMKKEAISMSFNFDAKS